MAQLFSLGHIRAMKLSTSQFAKWSAIATLMLAGLCFAMPYLQDRFDNGRDKLTISDLSVMDFICIGVSFVVLFAPIVCIVALILVRQQRKTKDDHVA